MTSDPASASVAASAPIIVPVCSRGSSDFDDRRLGEFADATRDREGMSAEGEQQAAVRAAFAEPDQGIRGGAGVADLAAEHRLERVPVGDLAEEAMVGDREARGEPGAQSLALLVDRQLGENRIRIRR